MINDTCNMLSLKFTIKLIVNDTINLLSNKMSKKKKGVILKTTPLGHNNFRKVFGLGRILMSSTSYE